jgi:glycosyltransferase involved in cell wall biosynthesis
MLYGVAAARLARIPVVIHGEHGFTEEDSARRKLFRKQLSYFVDDIVTVSESVKKTIVREIGINERKITAAVNGVDDTRFDIAIDRRAKRRTLGIGEHDPVIGTVGRLVPVKDYPTLLRAFSRVITWHANARLLFVGDGRLRAELTALSGRLGLEGKVIFLGQRNDTNELLKIMDIFVLSSLSEGMSNAILEAMMARLPVIATRAGNNALLIKEGVTGRFFPVSDSFALSRVLIDLLGDKNAREAMGTAGYEQVKQQFSLDSMIRRYETIYKYWLRKKGVSRPQ